MIHRENEKQPVQREKTPLANTWQDLTSRWEFTVLPKTDTNGGITNKMYRTHEGVGGKLVPIQNPIEEPDSTAHPHTSRRENNTLPDDLPGF